MAELNEVLGRASKIIDETYSTIYEVNPENVDELTIDKIDELEFEFVSDYVRKIMSNYGFNIIYSPIIPIFSQPDVVALLSSKNEKEFLENLDKYLEHLKRWVNNELYVFCARYDEERIKRLEEEWLYRGDQEAGEIVRAYYRYCMEEKDVGG